MATAYLDAEEIFEEQNILNRDDIYLSVEELPFLSKNILVIDDDKDFTTFVDTILKDMSDVKVDIANDQSTAWKKLIKRRLHLIVMDICLPEISGIDLAQAMSYFYDLEIPIIFISSDISLKYEVLSRSYATNKIDFCSKPLNKKMFKKLIYKRLMATY